MAQLTPTVTGPDGAPRTILTFSTTLATRVFTGTVDPDTVDMEVSINGTPFSADPDFIVFEGTSWAVPNPAVFPEGLELLAGINTILVRAVSLAGSVSTPARIEANLAQESDIGVVGEPPTNITLVKEDQAVNIKVEGLVSPGFQGFNFYASRFAGGGVTGYQRVNLNLVSDSTVAEEIDAIDSLTVDTEVLLTSGGDPAADPLFYRLRGQQEDENEAVLQEDFDQLVEIPETVRSIRTVIELSGVRTIEVYSFRHTRSAGPNDSPATVSIGEFAAVPANEVLYYVMTAVFFDEANLLEFESSFSQEVVGHPLRVTATLGTFPTVSRKDLVRTYITAVQRSSPQVRVEEGSSLRETVIDPFTSEAERVRFIVDFFHRAQAPASLLQVDDPANTGLSDPVATNAYKQVLKQVFQLTNDADVQAIIDQAFEAYASRYGKFRRPGRFARGEVTFFTSTRPTRTILIPLGTVVSGGSATFRTTRSAQIPLNQLASLFDPITGRYQVNVPVQATTVGSSGNVGTGQVRRLVTRISGLSVINASEFFGGDNLETNKQLAERSLRALASVDSGTRLGYLQTAADVPGVIKTNVVQAGNPLMQRDLDDQGEHRGGKVDVWIQGKNDALVTDTFAFSFQIAQDIQFELIGLPADLEFRAVDPEVSAENPIVEMLDFPDAGYEFKNASTGAVFDLADVGITGPGSIRLSTDVIQPPVDLTDVVLGSYRRRIGNTFTFTRQPVSTLTSVVGVVSGTLPDASIALVHPDPPLEKGRSVLAQDFLTITATTDDDGNDVPSGDFIDVTDEAHVLIGEFPEFVDKLGANFLTVTVTNAEKTITYKGPDDPSGDPDYIILLGTQTDPLAIRRLETGDITSGQTVLINYTHDENFTATYTTNLVVSVTQDAIEVQRHATADVIAKEAVQVPLDIQATVVLNQGRSQSDVDPELRTNLENFISSKRLGEPVRQSDIIHVIEQTIGVSYVVVPLTRLVRGQGSQVVREKLVTQLSADVTQLPSLSSESFLVWIIDEPLDAATANGGGAENEFRGVFEDDIAMALAAGSVQLSSLGLVDGQAAIVGAGGAVIAGFTDAATLAADGFTTPAEQETERKRRTANKVLVSTLASDSPVNHQYAITYLVGLDSGAKDVDPGAAEHLVIGDLLFTYDQDQ